MKKTANTSPASKFTQKKNAPKRKPPTIKHPPIKLVK